MRKVRTLLALLSVLAFVGVASTPASAVTCSGGATMTIDVAGGESVRITLNGAEDPRTISVSPGAPSCGGFDTSTVTTIQVNGTGGDESFTMDQAGSAPFPHQNTTSIDLALGDGADTLVIIGQSVKDEIGLGEAGISLDGGSDADVIGIGTVETVAVQAGAGDDVVSAGKGQGLGKILASPITVDGEVGNDTLSGGKAKDAISGGSGNDSLKGSEGGDSVDGGGGTDVVSGGQGNDVVIGGAGKDRLKGGSNSDTLVGGDGNDSATGGGGGDAVNGGKGNDVLEGSDGDDNLMGQEGKDQLSGGKGEDHCLGGPDPDSITGCEHGRP